MIQSENRKCEKSEKSIRDFCVIKSFDQNVVEAKMCDSIFWLDRGASRQPAGKIIYSLCPPLLMPQMMGTGLPPVTRKRSLVHWWVLSSGSRIVKSERTGKKDEIRKSFENISWKVNLGNPASVGRRLGLASWRWVRTAPLSCRCWGDWG